MNHVSAFGRVLNTGLINYHKEIILVGQNQDFLLRICRKAEDGGLKQPPLFMIDSIKPCNKCGCIMQYVLPRFIIVDGEVIVPGEDNPQVLCWECSGCGHIKLSGSLKRI
jgi:hypothetical protein